MRALLMGAAITAAAVPALANPITSYTVPAAPPTLPLPKNPALLGRPSLLSYNAPSATENGVTVLFASPIGEGAACSSTAPCSLTTARDKAGFAAQDSANTGKTIEVRLNPGRYDLSTEPLLIRPEHGGSSTNNTRVLYRPAVAPISAATLVTLSGGKSIGGAWTRVSNTQIWAFCPNAPITATARRLYIEGGQNQNSVFATARPASTNITGADFAIDNTKAVAKPGSNGESLVAALADEPNLELRINLSFASWITPVNAKPANIPANINNSALEPKEAAFWDAATDMKDVFGDGAVDPVSLSYARAFLDEPGEFYVEQAPPPSGCSHPRMLYIPVSSAEVIGTYIIDPVAPTVVKVTGAGVVQHDQAGGANATIGQTNGRVSVTPVERVDFRGLVFAHTAYNFNDDKQRAAGGSSEIYFRGYVDSTQTIMLAPRQDNMSMANLDTFRTETWFFWDPNGPDTLGVRPGRPFAAAGSIERKRWREAYVPSAVRVRASRDVNFYENLFFQMAGSGLAYEGGARDVTINGNEFSGVGGGAVRVSSATVLDHHPYCTTYPGRADVFPVPVAPAAGGLPATGRPTDAYFPHRCDTPQTPASNGNVESPLLHARIKITENRIDAPGQEFAGAVAINVPFGRDTLVSRNDVVGAPYNGVWVGLGYGYFDQRNLALPAGSVSYTVDGIQTNAFPNHDIRPYGYTNGTILGNNEISFNYLDVLEELDDGGGVFVQSFQPNSTILGNYIIAPPRTGRVPPYRQFPRYAGVYLDEGAGGFVVSHNASQGPQMGVMISVLAKEAALGIRTFANYSDRQTDPLTSYELRDSPRDLNGDNVLDLADAQERFGDSFTSNDPRTAFFPDRVRFGEGISRAPEETRAHLPSNYVPNQSLLSGYDVCRSPRSGAVAAFACGGLNQRYTANGSVKVENVRPIFTGTSFQTAASANFGELVNNSSGALLIDPVTGIINGSTPAYRTDVNRIYDNAGARTPFYNNTNFYPRPRTPSRTPTR